MKTYWDYNDLEKMNMTSTDVEGLLDIELMSKGVMKATPPNLQPLKDLPPLERPEFFEVNGIIFPTLDQAEKFIDLNPLKEAYDYYGAGYEYKYTRPCDAKIEKIKLYNESEVKIHANIFKSNKVAEEFNEKEEKRFQEESSAIASTVEPVWQDWREKQSTRYKLEKINETYRDYLKMTNNDAQMAYNFLNKIYSAHEIDLAKQFESTIQKAQGEA